jgi:putative membrane protein
MQDVAENLVDLATPFDVGQQCPQQTHYKSLMKPRESVMRKALISATGAVALGSGITSTVNAQPYSGWGMMGPWGGYSSSSGAIGMIIWIVILALIVAAVVWLVRAMTQPGHQLPGIGRRSPGLDALEERYARGEIKREEYLEKKHDMSS